jgi:hypothetical protein
MCRRTLAWFFLLAISSLILSATTGCGSSGSTKPVSSQVSVSLSAGGSTTNAVSINQGQTLAIVAAITNDSGNEGVRWSFTGSGSLSNQTTTSVTYTAPSSGSAATATVTATSITDPSKSSSLKITVNGAISVTLTPSAPQSICVDQTVSIAATVANDPKNAGVQWSLSGNNGSNNGSLSNETGTSAVYNTANGIVGFDRDLAPFSADVTATSISDPTKSASLSIAITPLESYDGTLPAATFAVPYSFTLPTTGQCGKPPYAWSTRGELPPGLSLNGNVISGVPTYPGSPYSSFYLNVADSEAPIPNTGQSIEQSIAVNLPSGLAILTISLPQSDINVSYGQTLAATGGTQPYSWSMSAGSLPPGLSLASATGIISGSPSAIGTYNFTVKITDTATPLPNTATRNLSIVVQPALSLVTTTLPAGSVGAAYAQKLEATGGVPPYFYSLESGVLPANLSMNQLLATGVIAGVPTATGTSNFTVVTRDSGSATASGSLSIQIDAANCTNNANLNGSYAFLLSGPGYNDSSSIAYDYVGSFIADGAGNIAQGYVDSSGTFSTGTPGSLTGTYCIGPDNLGTIALNGLGWNLPDANNFEIALQAGGNGNATIYENAPYPDGLVPLAVSGVVRKQDTGAFNTTKISGNYAFELLNSTEYPAAEAGEFSADGTGNLSGMLDMNFLVFPTTTSITGGAFSSNDLVVSSVGRGTATFNVTDLGSVQLIFYVVNASQLLVMESGSSMNGSVLSGQIVQQAAIPYTNGSLSGVSVFGIEQFDNASVPLTERIDIPLVQIGLITWDGAGNFAWSADQNDAGAMSTTTYSGTYSVDSSGRVTLQLGDQPTVLYLLGPNQGFLYAANNLITGQIMNQSGNPFSNSSLSGTYAGGSWQTLGNANSQVEVLVSDGDANITGTVDSDAPTSVPYGPTTTPATGNYSISSNGRGTITQDGVTTEIFYVISPTQFLMIPNANPSPTVTELFH